MTTTELTERYCTRAEHPTWQHELRQSVRLQLALTEPGLNAHAVAAALRLVEDELRQQLLTSHPASAHSPAATVAAAVVLHMQQMALLAQSPACEVLRRELPVTEFALALRPTCHPPNVGWLLAA